MRVGRILGWFLFLIGAKRRQIAFRNLQVCFPDRREQWHKQIVRKHFDSLGKALVETGMCWWASDEELISLTHLSGIEHLREALQRGKGVILLSAHFTSLELGVRLLKPMTEAKIYPVYQVHENPLLEHIITQNRLRHAERVIDRDNVRDLLRALKANNAIWYAPDQAYGGRNTALVPFFGEPVATNIATSRLAQMSGAAVIPYFTRRLDDDSGYSVTLLPSFDSFPSKDPVADTARYHKVLEEEILRSPEQYFWVHKRFKSRPPGYKNIYADE
jgi:KDO2-lipid IV(A) lauroyltransferase